MINENKVTLFYANECLACSDCLWWTFIRTRRGDEYGGDFGICNKKKMHKRSDDGWMCREWDDEEKKRIEVRNW